MPTTATRERDLKMPEDRQEPETAYRVVVNHEEQYSIWPADLQVPAGWSEEGTVGGRQQCLDHIDKVWVDMRPLSLRRRMAEAASG
jgi:MbtH protein